MRVVLAFADVGLGIPLEEALEGLGHQVTWRRGAGDPPRDPAALGALPDAVILDGDGSGAALGDLAAAWRALDPAPGVIALGMTADAATRAAAARIALVPSAAESAALDRALTEAARLRFTAAITIGLARRALVLPADADAAAIVVAARGLDVELARAALRWHAQHYVGATARIDDLRAARALIVPEIDHLAHMQGTLTVQSVVRHGPLDGFAAARLVWALAAVGAVTLTPEPPDTATRARRALTELRAHLRARAERLTRATFYDVLEVTPLAEDAELDTAYRVLAWRYGPQRTRDLDLGDATPLVAPAWEQIERARKVLSDIAARGRYDDWVRAKWPELRTRWAIEGPSVTTAHDAYGRAQQALTAGDVHRALSEMATAARHHPGHPDYEAGLAWTRYRVETAGGNDPAVIARRERAVATAATAGSRPWPRALLALALLCVADRDHEAARWHLREALAVDPASPAARQLMARLGG